MPDPEENKTAFQELGTWHHRQPEDHCYECDAPPPAGGEHTADHVVPLWLAPRAAAPRPTAALCTRCKVRMDDVDRRFKNEVAFRVGSRTRMWSTFKASVLENRHPLSLYERVQEIFKTRRVLVDGVARFARRDVAALREGVRKMTEGLFRVVAGLKLTTSSIRVALLDDVDHFLRVGREGLATFRVGDDLDVVVEGLDDAAYGRPLFRFRFARRFAVMTAAGSSLIAETDGAKRFRLGKLRLPDRP